MGTTFVNTLVAFIPAVLVYYFLKLRISEVEASCESRIRNIRDRVEFLSEEIYAAQYTTRTQTSSTSVPAVMLSAPKTKRTRKPK